MKKSASCQHIVPALSTTSVLSSTSTSFGHSSSHAPSSKFTSTYTANRRPPASTVNSTTGVSSIPPAGGGGASGGAVSRTTTTTGGNSSGTAAAPVAAASMVKLTEEDIERQFRAIARPSVPCADSWSFRSIFPSGSILPNCILAVDCDEDGVDELIVGSTDGLLAILKTTLRVPVATTTVQGTIAALSFESAYNPPPGVGRDHHHLDGGTTAGGGAPSASFSTATAGASASTVAATPTGAGGGGLLPRSMSMANLSTPTGGGGSNTHYNNNALVTSTSAASLSTAGGGGGANSVGGIASASSASGVHESFTSMHNHTMGPGERRRNGVGSGGGGHNVLYVTSLEGLVTVIDITALIQNAGATSMGGGSVVAEGVSSGSSAVVAPTARVDPMTLGGGGISPNGNHTAMPPPLTTPTTTASPSSSTHHNHTSSNMNGSASPGNNNNALNATTNKMDQAISSANSSPLVTPSSNLPTGGGLPPPMQHSNNTTLLDSGGGGGAVGSTSVNDGGGGKGSGRAPISTSLPAPTSSSAPLSSTAAPHVNSSSQPIQSAQTPNTSSSPHNAHSGRHHQTHTHSHHHSNTHHHHHQQLLPVVLGVHVIPANVTCSAIVGDLLIVGSLDRRVYVFRRRTMELRRSYFLASQICAIQPFSLPPSPPSFIVSSNFSSPLSPHHHQQPFQTNQGHPSHGADTSSFYHDGETSAYGLGHVLPDLDPHTSQCVIVATTMHVLLIDVGDIVAGPSATTIAGGGGIGVGGVPVTSVGANAAGASTTTPVLMASYIQQHSDASVGGGGAGPVGPDKSWYPGNPKGVTGGGVIQPPLSSTYGRQQNHQHTKDPQHNNNNYNNTATASPAASMASLPSASASSTTATNTSSQRQTQQGDHHQANNNDGANHPADHVDGDEFTFAYWVHPIDRNSFTIHGGRPVMGSSSGGIGNSLLHQQNPNSPPRGGGGGGNMGGTTNTQKQQHRGGGSKNINNSPENGVGGGGGGPHHHHALLMNPRLVSSCHTSTFDNSTYLAVSTEDGYSTLFEFRWMLPSQAGNTNATQNNNNNDGGGGDQDGLMTSSFHSQEKGGGGSKSVGGGGGGGDNNSNASARFRSHSVSTTASGGLATTTQPSSSDKPVFPTIWVPATVGGAAGHHTAPPISQSTKTPPLSTNASAVSLSSLAHFPSSAGGGGGATNPPPPPLLAPPIMHEVPVLYVRQLWGVKVYGGAQRIYVVPVARKVPKAPKTTMTPVPTPKHDEKKNYLGLDVHRPSLTTPPALSSSIHNNSRPSVVTTTSATTTAHQDKHPGHLGRMLPAKSPKAIITTSSSSHTPKHYIDPNTVGGGSSGRFPPPPPGTHPPLSNNNSNIGNPTPKAVAVISNALSPTNQHHHQLLQQQQHYHDLVVVVGTSTGQLFVIDRKGSTLLSHVPVGAMSFLPIQPPPLSSSSSSAGGVGGSLSSPTLQQHHHHQNLLQLDSLNLVSVSVRELVLMNVSTTYLGSEGICRSVSCSGVLSAASTPNFIDMLSGAQNCTKAIIKPYSPYMSVAGASCRAGGAGGGGSAASNNHNPSSGGASAAVRLPTMGTKGLDSEWFSSLICGIMQSEVTHTLHNNNHHNDDDGGDTQHQPPRRLQFTVDGSVDLPPPPPIASTAPGINSSRTLHDLPTFQPPHLLPGKNNKASSLRQHHQAMMTTPTSMSPDQQLSLMTTSAISALAEVAHKFQEHFLNNDVTMTAAAAAAELEGGSGGQVGGVIVGGGTVPWKEYGVSPLGSSAPGIGNSMNPISLSFGGGSTNNNSNTKANNNNNTGSALLDDEAYAAAMYTVGVLLHGYSDRHWEVFAAAAAEEFPS